MKYRAEIDGLRALSVLPIILFHANIGLLRGGFIGVDIFFVISGYLITTILMGELKTQRYSIINFYARRARRILPALLFVLFFTTFFAAVTLSPIQLGEYFKSLFSVSVFASNFYFWSESGYFSPQMEYTYLLHTWSLAVEEQYYLIFPVFLSIAWRFGKKWAFSALLLLTIASFVFCLVAEKYYPDGNYYLTPSRMWELFAGAIAAFILDARQIRGNNILSFVGLALIAVPMFLYDERTPFPSAYALPPILGAVLLILFCTKNTLLAQLLSIKPMVGIGLISYSAYLWHQPFLVVLRLMEPAAIIAEYREWIAIALTFIAGVFSYHYIEQPFRKKKPHRFPPLKTVLVSAMVLMLVCGASLVFAKNSHLLFSDRELSLMASAKRSNLKSCTDPQNLCSPDATDEIDVLLLGDSNAYHFSTALNELAQKHGQRFVNMTLGGCLPLSQFYRLDQKQVATKKCRNFNATIRESLQARTFDGTVVLSAAWLLYLYSTDLYAEETARSDLKNISVISLSNDGKTTLDNTLQEEFWHYLENAIGFLSLQTDNLVVIGPMPPALVNFDKRRSLLSAAASQRATFEEYNAPFETEIRRLQKKYSFTYLTPADRICKGQLCHVADEEGYLYGDPTHLSRHGQEVIMKPLLEKAVFGTKSH